MSLDQLLNPVIAELPERCRFLPGQVPRFFELLRPRDRCLPCDPAIFGFALQPRDLCLQLVDGAARRGVAILPMNSLLGCGDHGMLGFFDQLHMLFAFLLQALKLFVKVTFFCFMLLESR